MSLQRRLNLFDATLLVVGNVAGAGIFTTSGFLARELPHPWLFVGIWVIGGVLTLCGALTYAEMSGMFPRSGGDYLFLKESYGSWAGFLLGWVSFWIINPGSIAVLSISIVKYLTGFFPFTGGSVEKLLAVGIIGLFSLLHCQGVRPTGTAQNFWTLAGLTLLLVFIVGGFTSPKGNWGHFAADGPIPLSPAKDFGPAMIAVIFAYSGWFVSAYVGDEIKRPERNLPLSFLLGTLIVMVLYVLVNVVYVYAMPVRELEGVIDAGQAAAKRLLSPAAAHVVSGAVVLVIAASINATMLAGARLSYAMARDELLWSPLRILHPVKGTPHVAIVAQAGIASLFVIAGTFEGLLSSVVFVMLLSSIGSGAAHMLLRRRSPLAPRPYRTWGYPWVPLVFTLSYMWIAGSIVISNPARSLLGLLVTASGIPFYLYAVRRRGYKGETLSCIKTKANRPVREGLREVDHIERIS